eukprot:453365-Prorocentrum_lima.AAC.1
MFPRTEKELENHGIYTLQSNSWYLAHHESKEVKKDMKACSNKYKRPWYCACCGEKYEPGKHLKDRLL